MSKLMRLALGIALLCPGLAVAQTPTGSTIGGLPAVTVPTLADQLPVFQGGVTKNETTQQILGTAAGLPAITGGTSTSDGIVTTRAGQAFLSTPAGVVAAAGILQTTPTFATLQALPVTAGAQVYRLGYYAAGDGGEAFYTYSATACTLNSGAGDNGTQVSATAGGCWNASVADGKHFNVLMFGAKFDCATNDSAAWQAAINAAQVPSVGATPQGGQVDAPRGCSIAGGLVITAYTYPIKIQGQGPGGTVIKALNIASTVLTISGTNIQIDGVGFVPFVGTGQVSGSYIHLTSVTDGFWLSHFAMTGGYVQIQIDGGVGEYISDGVFANSAPGSSTIVINGGGDQYFTHLISDNPPTAQPTYGFLVTNNGGFWIADTDFIHSGTGLAIMPGNGQTVTWGSFHDFDIDTSAADAILIAPSGTGTVRGLNFTDTWTATSNRGVHIMGTGTTNQVSFVHHRAYNNGHEGFLVENGADIAILDSQVCGNSSASVGTYNGVEFGVGMSHYRVQNNRIGNCAGFIPTQLQNIAMDAGTGSDFMIQGNDLEGSTSGHGYTNNATGVNQIISGNQADDRLPSGLLSVTGSPFSYAAGPYNLSVTVAGGTVSNITVGGSTVASSSPASFTMRPGQSFTVTYSAVPTIFINAAN